MARSRRSRVSACVDRGARTRRAGVLLSLTGLGLTMVLALDANPRTGEGLSSQERRSAQETIAFGSGSGRYAVPVPSVGLGEPATPEDPLLDANVPGPGVPDDRASGESVAIATPGSTSTGAEDASGPSDQQSDARAVAQPSGEGAGAAAPQAGAPASEDESSAAGPKGQAQGATSAGASRSTPRASAPAPPLAAAPEPPREEPVRASWPGPNSTGVPAGVVLQERGDMRVTSAGAVVDGVQINGTLTIRADDVTVKNSRVKGGWIDVGSDQRGIVIMDTEIDGDGGFPSGQGIGYNGYACIRCDIHSIGRGINASGDVTLKDSWIHDMVVEGDPGAGGSHNEAVLSNGGRNIQILGNRLDAGRQGNFSGSLAFYGDFAPIRDVLVQGNRFTGGGFCVYAGSVPSKPFPRASNARFVDNVFSRDIAPGCGFYGSGIAYYDGGGNSWQGNRWEDTGAPVPTPAFQ